MKYFWKDWKRKTKLEREGIKSVMIGLGIVLKNIPKNEIVSVYVKGSFARREMNEKSDVDLSIIVRHSRWLRKLKQLDRRYSDKYYPEIQFSGYSLWELRHNKKSKTGKKLRASPSRAVRHLEHYELIYGELLKKDDFNQGPHNGHLRGMVNVFNKFFLPSYKEKRFSFSQIIKQIFWLVENEQIFRGKNAPHNWSKLAKSIKNKSHIVHDALRFRKKPTNDKKKRAKFIKKLEKYLSRMEKLVKAKY